MIPYQGRMIPPTDREGMVSAMVAVVGRTKKFPVPHENTWEPRYVSVASWEGFTLPSPQAYWKEFGSIVAAVEEACLKLGRPMPEIPAAALDRRYADGETALAFSMGMVIEATGYAPVASGQNWDANSLKTAERLGVRLRTPNSYRKRFKCRVAGVIQEVERRTGIVAKRKTMRQRSNDELEERLLNFYLTFEHFPVQGGYARSESDGTCSVWNADTLAKAAHIGVRLPEPSTLRKRFGYKEIKELWDRLKGQT